MGEDANQAGNPNICSYRPIALTLDVDAVREGELRAVFRVPAGDRNRRRFPLPTHSRACSQEERVKAAAAIEPDAQCAEDLAGGGARVRYRCLQNRSCRIKTRKRRVYTTIHRICALPVPQRTSHRSHGMKVTGSCSYD